jgi:hypothetical protein
MNDDARAWLDELPCELEEQSAFAIRLPIMVAGTVMRARAIAEQRDHGTARARVRSSASGRWLVCTRRACAPPTARSATPRS